MKKKPTPILIGLSFLILGTLAQQSGIARAQGTAFTYQGQLSNTNIPVAGSYDFNFALFDASTNGNQISTNIWMPDQSVTNGLFTVLLDFGPVFDGNDRWLEIATRKHPTGFGPAAKVLSPRQLLTPTPYAVTAAGLNSLRIGANTNGAPNLVGGASVNWVPAGVNGATIAGGGATAYYGVYAYSNRVTGDFGTVGGGQDNQSSGNSATVSGGGGNFANGSGATVGGGSGNLSANTYATVAGGLNNRSTGNAATVGGGRMNTNAATDAFIGGGNQNQIGNGAPAASIVGGEMNVVSTGNDHATVGGGFQNTVASPASTVGGGWQNTIRTDANNSTIGGGANNWIMPGGWNATVGGGINNNASGYAATIPGGEYNTASGEHSFAAGYYAQAVHSGSFVWADATGMSFSSTTSNQFSVRASEGVNFRVAGGGLRVEPIGTGGSLRLGFPPNMVGGCRSNSVANDVMAAVIAGGGADKLPNTVSAPGGVISGGYSNTVGAVTAAIGGGENNVIGDKAESSFIGSGQKISIGAGSAFSVIAGGDHNRIGTNVYAYATIASSVIGGGFSNTIPDNVSYAVIGGGLQNIAKGFCATVGGGAANVASGDTSTALGYHTVASGFVSTAMGCATTASGDHSTAMGFITTASGINATAIGLGSTATGDFSTAMGAYTDASGDNSTAMGYGTTASGGGSTAMGINNTASGWGSTAIGYLATASGDNSLAIGAGAKATHTNCFIWSDGAFKTWPYDPWDFPSTTSNQVRFRATGSFDIVTSVDANGYQASGVYLLSGDNSWRAISDRSTKKNIQPVDGTVVLDKLAQVPVSQWHYNWEKDAATLHLGPMAQDFIHAFYPGENDKSITTMQFDGVELAAIQGLNQKLEAKAARIQEQASEIDALKQSVAELKKLVQTIVEKK